MTTTTPDVHLRNRRRNPWMIASLLALVAVAALALALLVQDDSSTGRIVNDVPAPALTPAAVEAPTEPTSAEVARCQEQFRGIDAIERCLSR